MSIEATGPKAQEAITASIEKINLLNTIWDADNPDSEIGKLNAQSTVTPSDDTQSLLTEILNLKETTGNTLDLTVYPLMTLWGFLGDRQGTEASSKIPSPEAISACLEKVGWEHIHYEEADNRITLDPGTKLDFGAVAKGYATDRVTEILKEYGVTSALISLGGNLYCLGNRTNGTKWRLGIENPRSEEGLFGDATSIGILSLSDSALVTSGDYRRYFTEDGKRYHHIMDPKTGYPADNSLISVTIVCKEALKADALSTALFVMGKEKALSYWKAHANEFDAVFVEADGSITITSGIQNCFESKFSYRIYE